MADNKYANAKCFVFSPDGYEEITYSELCRRRETDKSYAAKKFLPLHGMLMEVTPEQYREFYKERRHQKYLRERSEENGDFSYDMLTTEDFNGADILVDDSEDIAELVTRKIMLDKLKNCLSLLTPDEKLLISKHFFEEMSQVELSKEYGVNQSNISRRIGRILQKLKNLLET